MALGARKSLTRPSWRLTRGRMTLKRNKINASFATDYYESSGLKYTGKCSFAKRIYLHGNGNKTDRIPDSFVGNLFRVVVHSKHAAPETGGLG